MSDEDLKSRGKKAVNANSATSSKSAELFNLDQIRRARKKIPSKKEPRVLFLQGPVGSFFKQAQNAMNAAGFDAWRVCFNAGDRFFANRQKTLHFAGNPDAWRSWFATIAEDSGFDFVILFGCERQIHAIALDECRKIGLPVLCLEEGYIRSGYVTMEYGGNNWLSPVCGALPPASFREPERKHSNHGSYANAFMSMATNAAAYFTLRSVLASQGERSLFHKAKRKLVSEAFYWTKNYCLKNFNSVRNHKLIERLLEHYEKKYYVVPLQVHDDSQLGKAASGWSNQKLILKSIVSFARNAPPGHQLVFKIHPMERGHSRDAEFIQQVSVLNHVASRVHVLDGGSLGLITRHSAGMITINSTSGFSAITHGVPLAVLGKAIYRHPDLAFCVSKGIDLDRFWTWRKTTASAERHRYIQWIMQQCLVPGDYYAQEGIETAIAQLIERIQTAASLQGTDATPADLRPGLKRAEAE